MLRALCAASAAAAPFHATKNLVSTAPCLTAACAAAAAQGASTFSSLARAGRDAALSCPSSAASTSYTPGVPCLAGEAQQGHSATHWALRRHHNTAAFFPGASTALPPVRRGWAEAGTTGSASLPAAAAAASGVALVPRRSQSVLAYLVMKRYGLTPDGELPEEKEKEKEGVSQGDKPLGDYPGKGDGTSFGTQLGTAMDDDDEVENEPHTPVNPVDVQTAVFDGFKALMIGLLVGIPLAIAMAATVVGVAMTMASGQVQARKDGIHVSLKGLQAAGTREEQLQYEREVLHQLPQSAELDLRIQRIEQELRVIAECVALSPKDETAGTTAA